MPNTPGYDHEHTLDCTCYEVAAAQKVYLFHEFNDVMARLYKKYGVVEVAEQCRAWADFIDGVRAKKAARNDGPEDDGMCTDETPCGNCSRPDVPEQFDGSGCAK